MNKAKKASPSKVIKDKNGVVSPIIDQDAIREMVKEIIDCRN